MKQKTSPAGLVKPPAELVNEIFKYMPDAKDAANLCRSSKRLYQMWLPWLYRSIDIPATQLPRLLWTLLERPDLARLVHTFALDFRGYLWSWTCGTVFGAICLDEYNRQYQPQSIYDLIQPALRQLGNLVELQIRCDLTFRFVGPSPALDSLTKVVFTCRESEFRVGEQFSWLARRARNLHCIELCGAFVIDELVRQRCYPYVTELTIANKHPGDKMESDIYVVLEACTKLKSFTYKAHEICNPRLDPLDWTLTRALMPCRKELQSLRLIPMTPHSCPSIWHFIDSLRFLTRLQHLSIATRFMVLKKTPSRSP